MLLEARELKKSYAGRNVVDGVSLNVHPGEIVGLLGPNGAGKTTTFYMVVGLEKPSEGQIFLGQEVITYTPMHQRARKGISYLAQEDSIFQKMTVEENILAILEMIDISAKERKERLTKLLEEFSVTHLAKQKGSMLSGGERRRVEIARALAVDPTFILLDEPFAGVDPISVLEIQDIVRQLKDRGLGVLITDHNVRETLAIIDRAYLMHQGKILVSGTSDEVAGNELAKKFYLGESFSL